MKDISQAIKSTIGHPGPIGVFDSGYGGLTILKELRKALPDADFIYLGDNARAPYGTRSFDLVYHFTLEAVRYLFARGCQLVIIACNTASAKALRTIQQNDLPDIDPTRRVLGVIRPTAEIIGEYTSTAMSDYSAPPAQWLRSPTTWSLPNSTPTSYSPLTPAPCGYHWLKTSKATAPEPTIS